MKQEGVPLMIGFSSYKRKYNLYRLYRKIQEKLFKEGTEKEMKGGERK